MKPRTTASILFLLLNTACAEPQTAEILYYDKDWKGTTNRSEAEYYRVVTFDAKGKPIGAAKDYYITGELQAEVANPIHIDREDDSKTTWRGESVVYYKTGQKRGVFPSDEDGVEHGSAITWYENGNKEQETHYQHGLKHGPSILWLSNGNKLSEGEYELGQLRKVTFYNPDGSVQDTADTDALRKRESTDSPEIVP